VGKLRPGPFPTVSTVSSHHFGKEFIFSSKYSLKNQFPPFRRGKELIFVSRYSPKDKFPPFKKGKELIFSSKYFSKIPDFDFLLKINNQLENWF
jgi:hypothetical protein